MQAIRDVSITFGQAAQKAHDAGRERIARFGFRPDCQCTWCGDTGLNREEGAICFCPAGERKAEAVAREASWSHLVPTRFERYTLDGCPNTPLVAKVAEWLAGDPTVTGQNLVISGGVGRGKTGAAIGALRELHMAGKSVAYWSLPNLMDIFRLEERGTKLGKDFTENRPAPVMEQITRIDCVLLDDLGQERVTDYVAERLYVLIDGRYVATKPTILTTNLSRQDLEAHIGERSASRIRENYCSARATGRDLRDRSGNGAPA
jgi:DNA replication protein DnaC